MDCELLRDIERRIRRLESNLDSLPSVLEETDSDSSDGSLPVEDESTGSEDCYEGISYIPS
jgi:hypothetical protein